MNSASWTGETIWKQGVIKRISDGAYWVELSETPGKPPIAIPIRAHQWARPAAGVVPTKPGTQAQVNRRPPSNEPQQPANQREHGQVPANDAQEPIKQVHRRPASLAAHAGPHKPTVAHIKQMIIDKHGWPDSERYETVDFSFTNLQVSGPTKAPDQNPTTIGRLRIYGVLVHPVSAKFTVHVADARAGVNRLYDYDMKYYWYIDNRGECTLAHVGGSWKSKY